MQGGKYAQRQYYEKKAAGEGDGANYEEITYEGYGPGGVAVIVEAAAQQEQDGRRYQALFR